MTEKSEADIARAALAEMSHAPLQLTEMVPPIEPGVVMAYIEGAAALLTTASKMTAVEPTKELVAAARRLLDRVEQLFQPQTFAASNAIRLDDFDPKALRGALADVADLAERGIVR